MHYPAPTTNLDSLHDLVAQLEAVSQRWLDNARVKPEPPTTVDISNISISVRRITLIHRDIYKLENPGLAFPQSHNRARARNLNPDSAFTDPNDLSDPVDPVDPTDPEIPSKNSSSSTPTYSREISRYIAARIVASIKSKPEDAADCCPDLYEEMDLMKSNPAYHAEALSDFYSTNATPTNSPAPTPTPTPTVSSPTHTLTPTQAAPASPPQFAPISPNTHSPTGVAPATSPVYPNNSVY